MAGPAVVVLFGPCREGGGGQWRAAIGPVHHIDGRIEQPVLHGEVAIQRLVLVVVNEEVERVAMHIGCGVRRITVMDDGALCLNGHCPQAA